MSRKPDLSDYVEVKDRIPLFYDDHPDGRIVTDMVHFDPPLIVMKATLYRDHEQGTVPLATGHAYEKEGEGYVNQTSYIENCETSAIGRALADAGYIGGNGDAPRPSREEMEKVARMRGDEGEPGTSDVTCPDCDGPAWDNRDDDKAAANGGKRPNFKCKDTDDCGWASWDSELADEEEESEPEPEPDAADKALREAKKDCWEALRKLIADDAEMKPVLQAYGELQDEWAPWGEWMPTHFDQATLDFGERGTELLEEIYEHLDEESQTEMEVA